MEDRARKLENQLLNKPSKPAGLSQREDRGVPQMGRFTVQESIAPNSDTAFPVTRAAGRLVFHGMQILKEGEEVVGKSASDAIGLFRKDQKHPNHHQKVPQFKTAQR